ncbi:MAG: hypothetical protein RBT49_02310 [Bacteroidales bacterium]|jgi:hypothetical protein|nr:hypothetical protein [Bacteroidales bacterium]
MKTEELIKYVIKEEPMKVKETLGVILKQKIADEFKKNVNKKD